MKCPCGGGTHVVNTLQLVNAIRRQRKCNKCSQSFYSLEMPMDADRTEAQLPRPIVRDKTKMEKCRETVLKNRVESRRKAEDIREAKAKRDYVPSYYIEEDYD